MGYILSKLRTAVPNSNNLYCTSRRLSDNRKQFQFTRYEANQK